MCDVGFYLDLHLHQHSSGGARGGRRKRLKGDPKHLSPWWPAAFANMLMLASSQRPPTPPAPSGRPISSVSGPRRSFVTNQRFFPPSFAAFLQYSAAALVPRGHRRLRTEVHFQHLHFQQTVQQTCAFSDRRQSHNLRLTHA